MTEGTKPKGQKRAAKKGRTQKPESTELSIRWSESAEAEIKKALNAFSREIRELTIGDVLDVIYIYGEVYIDGAPVPRDVVESLLRGEDPQETHS